MNIRKYMKEHESFVEGHLPLKGKSQGRNDLKEKHQRMIRYMQHERLVHLLVTLAIGFFLLLTMAVMLIRPSSLFIILTGIFLLLLIFYILHYYFLENTIQRWYRMMDRIEEE